LIVTVVNIIVFWISYKIMDTLVFYRNRHRHFSEKLKTDLR
jgi:valyl-tRNA synthetase